MNTSAKIINKLDLKILILFAIFEVLLFNSSNIIKLVVSTIEYLFVFFVFIKNCKIGILYFFSFLILSIGFGNYAGFEDGVSNFWGLRFFGVSFSIVVLMIFSLIIFSKKNIYDSFRFNSFSLFLFLFITYGFVNGAINVVFHLSYLDNFINDSMTYIPFFFYIVLLNYVEKEDLFLLFKYLFPISIIQVLLSAMTNNKSFYSDYFIVTNCIGLILPIAVFFLKKYYKFSLWIFMVFVIGYVFYTSQYFISGKLIILVLLVAFVKIINNKKFYWFIGPLILVLFFLNDLFVLLIDLFGSSKVIVFKFSQVQDLLFNVNFDVLARTPTSIGNLIAEYLTTLEYLLRNPFYFIFGKGFGAGLPDIFGYLSPWVYENGYAPIDLSRNEYFRAHLPVFDIFLKGGIFFLIFYLLVLFRYIKKFNTYGVMVFMMTLTIFNLTKEMMLATLILNKLFEYSINSSDKIL